jgi:hypothetical protein
MSKSKKNNIELVPFDEMPKDLPKLLTKNDYTYALLHPDGFRKGLFEAVHLNVNYPQWHNVMLHPHDENDIVIYTRRGWVRKDDEYIEKFFGKEYIYCFIHVMENKTKYYGIKDDKK